MSNSIGNLKNSGLQGNNFPWQLKMLIGQECICDQLKLANDILQEIDDNTDQVEPLLVQILAAIQNGSDFEAFLVVDANDVTWLEVRIWNPATGSFDPPVYFAVGSNTPGTPALPISYINPNSYLAQIVSYTSNLVSIEAGTPDALGQTTMSASMPVTIASDQTPLPVNATLVGPTGTAACVDSFPVTLCTDQAKVYVTPVLLASSSSTGNLTAYAGTQILSISFASNGTADAEVSVDGGVNYLKLAPGMTINLDANGIMNYYNPNLFYWDTSLTAGASLLIAFNFI